MAEETVIDVQRHAGQEVPSAPIPAPKTGDTFEVVENVVKALPIPGTTVTTALNYGMSLWGRTAKIICSLPDDNKRNYFLKVLSLGDLGRTMLEGEFESLKAIHSVSPTFAPEPYAWGHYGKPEMETYFLLTEFRDIGEQPPDPIRFTARLAELHRNSVSPTGKFGFPITTCVATLPQVVEWEDSWAVLYRKQMQDLIRQDAEKNGYWPESKIVCDLITSIVIPRLLEPLQSEGRSIKPCLMVGDLWDENTATDMNTGEPFVFDAGSMYVSEPEEEWDARNLLYSLRYNLSPAIFIPGCNLRQVVFEDMTELCKKFCPKELHDAQKAHQEQISRTENNRENGAEEEEEEEEEEKNGEMRGYLSMSDDDRERLREDMPTAAVTAEPSQS
ncbi:MAG: hypothetical protein LQ347_006459 [Umbilicaria vellea]|nr:MAG: hypothetical protein LQ347_006459 [Umbilicaria vellea]